MAATRRQVNIRSAVFTPTSGSPVTITGVTGLNVDGGGTVIKFAGDGDQFNTMVTSGLADPSISFNTADFSAVSTIGNGARGSISVTVKDAKNKSASLAAGDVTYVMSPAVCNTVTFSQQFNQVGGATLMFSGESVDGATSPVSATFS